MVSMKEPVRLIESDGKGSLRVVPSALEILEQIEQKVVVVSVVGLFRTGKSYLMNRLAGANKGFALGADVQAKTKGIWMWCVPHPRRKDHTLVLLDTEGLGDVELGDTKYDNFIFAMAVLLSSTLVYNSMGVIDNKSMENLHYVTEMTKTIKIKSKEKDDDLTIVQYLPSFVWAVRDFGLRLKIDGKRCTADEYLENSIKEIEGGKPEYNEPRACLRKFFLPRHCFVFERPGNARLLQRMDKVPDAELEPDFVKQADKFTEHIYTKSDTKFIGDGIKVTGRMLGQLAKTYAGTISRGEVPCLENAVKALALIENTKAVEQAQVLYVKRMKTVRFPTKTFEELSAIHAYSEKKALALFMNKSLKDDKQKYQKRLMSAIQVEYNQISEKNFKESRKACGQIIKKVFKPLENKVKDGLYSVLEGYKMFCNDLEMMTDKYNHAEGRGVKAEEVLKTYLDQKAIVGQAIMAADNSLSEAQRILLEEKAKKEAAERENLLMAKEQKEQEKKRAEEKESYDRNVKALNDKNEKDQKDAQDRQDTLVKQMQDQMQKANEGEIRRLEGQINAIHNQPAPIHLCNVM